MADDAAPPSPAPRPRLQRRLRLRLSPERLDDAAFLEALDARSEALGEIDHAFIRRCLLDGFQLGSRIDALTNSVNALETYATKSQYTHTDTTTVSSPTGSVRGEHSGSGVRTMAGLMSGRSSHEGNST